MKHGIFIILCYIALSYNASGNPSVYNPPSNLSVTDLQETEANLLWNGNANAVSWIVNYKVLMAEESIEIALQDTIINIQDIISGLRYIWKVKMIDSNGDTTAWSDISTFVVPEWETDCGNVEQLMLAGMTANGLLVQWNPSPGQLSWEVVCGDVGSNPNNEGVRQQTVNLNHTFTGLIQGKPYQIAVRGICNGSQSNWKFMNVKYVADNYYWSLPIQITFETEEENGKTGFVSGISNPWIIGSAENYTNQGNHSLYISFDEGATTNYIAAPTRSYAFTGFYIPQEASSYYIDFKWKSNTTNPNDRLKVYMLEENAMLNIDQMPEDLYLIGQTQYNGNYPQWQSEHLEMPASTFGYTRKVVFAWESDSSGTMAVALDDIYITGRYCPAPYALTANNITAHTATLHWQATEDQTLFNLQYRQTGDTTWQTVNGIDTGYVLSNLDINTEYQYRIQADCQSEQSFWSVVDTFTTALVINAPSNFRLTMLTDTAANLQWNVEGITNGWLFEYKEISGTYITLALQENEVLLDDLAPNTSYIARVRGVTAGYDTSSYSSEILFQTDCSRISTFPYTDLTDTTRCSAEGYCDLETCWRSNNDTLFSPYFDFTPLYTPEMSIQYKASASCQLLIYTRGGGYSLLETLLPTDGYAVKTCNLLPYENEDVIRFAFVNAGYESIPNYEFAITDFTIKDICVSPARLSFTELNRNEVAINWEAYPNNVQWQVVLWNVTGGDSISTFTDVRSWYYGSLVPDDEYIIGVRGICSAGDTAATFTELHFTAVDNMCMPPHNFECTYYGGENGSSIVCTWDSTDGILRWEIEYKSQYAIDPIRDSVWLDNQYTIRDVNPNQTYQIRARSVCMYEGDTSQWTDYVSLFTNSLSAQPYQDRTFEIFPNPTQGVINVKTDLPELKQAQLINSQGVVLRTWETLPMQIDIGNMPSGVYFIKVLIDDVPVSKRFTIQK
ncbi:MAG: fibronectin type III domain-containing protein [Bacteroidales bacterium]|jgi:hypothetical protein|nr:fibronectin type III domain-containing protein [Bacteroidales bacterium]